MKSEDRVAGGCPRRGRPRLRRIVNGTSESWCYKPCCRTDDEQEGILLKPEEVELIRLIDLEGLEQEEAAEKLGGLAQDSVAGPARGPAEDCRCAGEREGN